MVTRVVLRNGLRLIVREMRSSPVVALNLWVGSGSSDEPAELSGISHFMEHLLFKGSGVSGSVELAREVQDAGGYLNAETGCDHTMYYQVVPSAGWRTILRASVEAVSMPAFRDSDVDAERGVVMEEARSGESDPGVFIWRRLMEASFPGQPCGRPIVGTTESVARITPNDLRRHHASYHRAANLVQVVVGDVDAEEAVRVATELMSDMPSGGDSGRRLESKPPRDGLTALTFEGSIEQPYVAVAFDGPHALHPDVPALDALCGLLGTGHSSRLSRSLRSAEGAVSDIGCGLVAYREAGLVVVRAVASTSDTDRVVEGVFREVERLRTESPGGLEMEKNIRRLESAYVLEHETADSIAHTLGFFETLGDHAWSEEYIDRLARVRPGDIVKAAGDYLDPKRAKVICYVPGTPGRRSTDRTPETRELAMRAAPRPRSVLKEGCEGWSPPGALERPDMLREAGAASSLRLPLPGGGCLVSRESRGLPVVSLTLGFPGGFLLEPDGKAGLTYLAERMCFEGTAVRTADEISEAIEGLGSSLAFAVEKDGFGMGFTSMSKHFEEAIGVLRDVLVNPAFPEDRLSQAKLHVASEIREIEDHPLRRTLRMLLPLAFPGLPHGRPIRGTYDTIGGMVVSELAAWHRKTCVAEGVVACVVGDVSAERARDVVSAALDGLASSFGKGEVARNGDSGDASAGRRGSAAAGIGHSRPCGSDAAVLPGGAQSVVAIALPGPLGGTREAVVGRVIIRALSMMGGRLWRALRERPPHAYHIGGTLLSYRDAGATVAYATAGPGHERDVVDGLAAEFSKLAESGLEPEELERTKRQLSGTLEISLMRGASRSASYAMAEVMGAGYEYVERMSSEVATVTNDDVVDVATSLLNPSDGFAEAVLRADGGPVVR